MLDIDLTLMVVAFVTGWTFFLGQRGWIRLVSAGLIAAIIVNILVYLTNSPVASFL